MTRSTAINEPRVDIFPTREQAEAEAARIIIDLVKARPDACLGLATGGTPIPVYDRLALASAEGEVSFAQTRTFNLDEYCGLPSTHPDSFAAYMWHHLFSRADFAGHNVNLIKGDAPDAEAEAARYGEELGAQRRHVQILGIGENGHIGFNEPGSPADSRTRVVELSSSTIEANLKTLKSLDRTPDAAITIGIADILEAEKIIVLANGPAKAAAVARALTGEPNASCPASFLRYHPNVVWLIDQAAAQHLSAA